MSITFATDFSYKLTVVETLKEDQHFSCSINVDGKLKKFQEDKKGKTINSFDNDLKENINLNCTQKIDKVELLIYLDNSRVDKKTFTNINSINYDLIYNEVIINLNSENNTCILNKNNILEEFVVVGDLRIESIFFKTFKLTCDTEVESMEIKVTDNKNKDIYYDSFEDVLERSYNIDKTISKDYTTIIYLSDPFEKKNKCILTLDDNQKQTKTFTKDTKIYNKFLESKVGNLINLNCVHPINSLDIYVDDRRWDRELIHKTYNNSKGFNIKIDENMVRFPKLKKPIKEVSAPAPIKKKPVTKVIPKTEEIKEEPAIVPKVKSNSGVRYNEPIEKKSWWSKLWDWIW